MPPIFNTDLLNEMTKAGRLQVSKGIPNQLAEKVVPVMEVNPKLLRNINIVKKVADSINGSLTIYTTPTNQDFYLTNTYIQFSGEATTDATVISLTVVLADGSSIIINDFRRYIGCANNQLSFHNYFCPILLKRGSIITYSDNGTNAKISKSATIYGYIVENQI